MEKFVECPGFPSIGMTFLPVVFPNYFSIYSASWYVSSTVMSRAINISFYSSPRKLLRYRASVCWSVSTILLQTVNSWNLSVY